jgi:NADPH:quinone reductase-like Zn-dependent oxidoreductase
LLLVAAGGSIKCPSVEMPKLMDASTVIATASKQEEPDLAKDFEADVVINYTKGYRPKPTKEAGRGEIIGSPLPKPTS